MVKKLAQRLARKLVRGIVTLAYDNNGIQILQIKTLDGQVHEAPRLQEYGFTSVPKIGAEAMLGMINDSNGLVFAVDDRRYRLKSLASGEVALYDDEGSKIHIKRGGKIQVVAATQIDFETPLAHFSGDLTANGSIKDSASSGGYTMQEMRDLYDSHNHGENGGAGPTNAPNQVFDNE